MSFSPFRYLYTWLSRLQQEYGNPRAKSHHSDSRLSGARLVVSRLKLIMFFPLPAILFSESHRFHLLPFHLRRVPPQNLFGQSSFTNSRARAPYPYVSPPRTTAWPMNAKGKSTGRVFRRSVEGLTTRVYICAQEAIGIPRDTFTSKYSLWKIDRENYDKCRKFLQGARQRIVLSENFWNYISLEKSSPFGSSWLNDQIKVHFI